VIEKKLGAGGFSDVEKGRKKKTLTSRTFLNDAKKEGERGRREGGGERERETTRETEEGNGKEEERRTRRKRKRKGELQNDVFAMKRVD